MGFLTATNDFEAKTPDIMRADYRPGINEQYNQLNNVVGGQNRLATALMAQMNGDGPNPVQQQFQNNANQVAAQQAGAIASAKGINPALAAQLVAQQGSSAMQNAAGQGAQLQAQQQLGAQNQLQNLYGQQGQQAINMFGTMANANNAQNNSINQAQLGAQNINANVAGQNAAATNQMTGNVMNSLGGAAAMFLSQGGKVHPLNFLAGGHVPGKASVAGDSPKNDTVHAMLSPGEIVIPRSLVHDPERAKEFIKHINAKEKPKSYGDVVKKKRDIQMKKKKDGSFA